MARYFNIAVNTNEIRRLARKIKIESNKFKNIGIDINRIMRSIDWETRQKENINYKAENTVKLLNKTCSLLFELSKSAEYASQLFEEIDSQQSRQVANNLHRLNRDCRKLSETMPPVQRLHPRKTKSLNKIAQLNGNDSIPTISSLQWVNEAIGKPAAKNPGVQFDPGPLWETSISNRYSHINSLLNVFMEWHAYKHHGFRIENFSFNGNKYYILQGDKTILADKGLSPSDIKRMTTNKWNKLIKQIEKSDLHESIKILLDKQHGHKSAIKFGGKIDDVTINFLKYSRQGNIIKAFEIGANSALYDLKGMLKPVDIVRKELIPVLKSSLDDIIHFGKGLNNILDNSKSLKDVIKGLSKARPQGIAKLLKSSRLLAAAGIGIDIYFDLQEENLSMDRKLAIISVDIGLGLANIAACTAIGCALGTIIPGPGNVVGAAIGLVVGVIWIIGTECLKLPQLGGKSVKDWLKDSTENIIKSTGLGSYAENKITQVKEDIMSLKDGFSSLFEGKSGSRSTLPPSVSEEVYKRQFNNLQQKPISETNNADISVSSSVYSKLNPSLSY